MKNKIKSVKESILKMQSIASDYGISDIFQDNNGKLLEVLMIMDLKNLPQRCGNDAIDKDGNEYEIKTLNINKNNGITTHHHLDLHIIEKYRAVKWIFAFYRDVNLIELYLADPEELEPYFSHWEDKILYGGRSLNNPKIQASFIRKHGKNIELQSI